MLQTKRDNYLWFILLSIIALGAIVAFPDAIKLVAILGWVAAGLLTFTNLLNREWWSSKGPTLPLHRETADKSQTHAARQASARARARGNFLSSDFHLLDIGLIAINDGAHGPAFERTNSLSTEHQAVRPYIRLRLPNDFSERHGRLRFSFESPGGEEMFIHEQETWLTTGIQDVIPTHQMRVADSPVIDQLGDWKLEVTLDGRLIAEHDFRITPSINQRRERLQRDSPATSGDVTLDDLLADE